MNEALFLRRDALRRGGFTLIEVVIALAIFLFGALAIIRIFPPALGVIQNSGDRLTAVNLNRSTLARFARESSALPYAIYNNNPIPNPNPANYFAPPYQPVPFAGAAVGSAIRNNSIPRSNVQTITDSALDRFKLVSGEKQIVRSIGPASSPTFYVLTSFPIAGPIVSGSPNSRPPLARIYRERTLSGVTTQTKIPAGAPTYRSGFLDFSNASPTPPTAADDLTYYVSYRYFDGGFLNATNDEAVRSKTGAVLISAIPPVLDAPNTDVQLLQGRRLQTPAAGGTPNGVADGPVEVRYRQPLTGAISVDPDIDRQNTRNNLGILVLTGVARGEEVSIDYQINTWGQLVTNSMPSVTPETLPTPGPTPAPATPTPRTPREVVLPLRLLADEGDNATIYSLLSYLNTDTNNTPSLEANAMNGSDILATAGQFTLWGVNRKAGRVLFDINDHATTPQDYTVVQSRVVYQTLDNWNHQLSVAPTNYTPFYDPATNGNSAINTTAPELWRYYYWSRETANQPGRIYFPPSEAGKTISLSYSYRLVAGGPVQLVNNEVVTISDRWENAANAPTAAQDQNMAAPDANGNRWLAYAEPKIGNTGALPLVAIRSIKGVSVQARTAWLDGDKFNQVSTIGFRGDNN